MSRSFEAIRKLPCWTSACDESPVATHFLRVGEGMIPWGFFAACVALVLASCSRPESLQSFGICLYALIFILRSAEFVSEIYLVGQVVRLAPVEHRTRVRYYRRVVIGCAILNVVLLVALFLIAGAPPQLSEHPLS